MVREITIYGQTYELAIHIREIIKYIFDLDANAIPFPVKREKK